MIIAGTGHRPQFCPCGFSENSSWLDSIMTEVGTQMMLDGASTIISGAALGWDTWLAKRALQLGVPLHMYVPFRGQGSNWPTKSRKTYETLLEKAAAVKYISEEYSKDVFLKRDRAMVDDCEKVYALLNPEKKKGGTFYTVKYAQKNNKPVTNFWR